MGATKSRLAEPEGIKKNETASIPSTPILTPKIRNNEINQDPRSPSRHIARTPIEILSAAAEKLNSLKLDEIESNGIGSVLTPMKKHIMLGFDPRSPTVEVQRTPIVVSASPDKSLPAQVRNKNLEKVKKADLLETPKGHIPPKLLDSSLITPKQRPNESKRKSLAGLLETNIDFTETDLDRVIKEKYLANNLSYAHIDDPRSPTTDFLRTPLQTCDDSTDKTIPKEFDISEKSETIEEPGLADDNEANKNEVPIEQVDSQLNTIHVSTHDCITESTVICIHNTFELNDDGSVERNVEKEIITYTESEYVKSAPEAPLIDNMTSTDKSEPVTPSVVDLAADVKEFDRKLTNLIYEDADLVVCPRVVTIKEQNRTPLGIRNGNGKEKGPTHKLKVSNKPRKTENIISKIPVFKEKKIKVQCENTPPRSMELTKGKKSRWDSKDETLII